MSLGGILDEVTEFVLGVVATVVDGVVKIPIVPNDRATAICANLGQFRVFLDFDAPTLVLAEVEMELVHIMQCHHIQVYLH